MNKKKIFVACQNILLERRLSLMHANEEINESMQSETKSSLGDKHETARAKMQTEQEKLLFQIDEINKQITVLNKIDLKQIHTRVNFGALVKTNKALFFIAIGLGKVPLENDDILVVSAFSPIAKLMDGLKQDDSFEFNTMKYVIQKIL